MADIAAYPADRNPPADSAWPRNRRVLVIDDNPNIHADFRKILLGSDRISSAVEDRQNILEDFEKSILGQSASDRSTRSLLAGFELEATQQGQQGVALLAAARKAGRPFAMAFVDMRMPNGWDGVQTIEALWKEDPELQVVICTAHSDHSWNQIAGRLGRYDGLLILKKPFDDSEVRQLACALTEKWNLAAEARRQVQQMAQREAEWRKLSLVASRTNNGVVITDASGGTEWINAGFTRMTGYTLDELKGRRPGSVLQGPETDRATIELMAQRLNQKQGFRVEIINYSKDGKKYWVEIEVQPIVDADGTVRNFMAIETDITKRKRAEEEKFRLANHVSLLLDSTGEGIYGVDTKGSITFINRAAAHLLGYTPEEIIGRNSHALLHHTRADGTNYPSSQCPIYNCALLGEDCRVETEVFWRRDGSSFPVSYAAFQVVEKGEVAGAVVTFFDITARKQAEAELRNAKDAAESANRAKSEFLARMSHEIRTPLNGVVGIIDLLQDSGLNEHQQNYARLTREAADALITVINDILDFSKIEAGKIEIEHVEFDLHKLTRDLRELLGPVAAKKGVTIGCELAGDVPSRVVGDPNRVRQVLTNLVGNAIKFTSSGSIAIRVSLESRKQDDCFIAVEVQDTGIGIPAESIDRLFKSFSQVDTSTTRKYGGTGLGLAISKRLVELMGGQIGLTSELGKGTTFRFTLKLAAIPERAAAVNADPVASAKPAQSSYAQRLKGVRLLVAEDNVMNQFVIREMLKRSGCTCQIVGDGSQAVTAVQTGAYDAVLMDCQMPVMDGLEATRRIRERERATPGCRPVPIIALTAEAIAGDREKCLAAGMDGYASKPINAGELFGVIESLVPRDGAGSRVA